MRKSLKSYTAASSPDFRRPRAERSPPLASERRTRGDQRSTVRVASESHGKGAANRETMSRPLPRPPPENDTLAPRCLGDLSGVSAGVAPSSRWATTWLRHHAPFGVATAERTSAAGEWPARPCRTPCGRPVRPCPRHGGRSLHGSSAGRIAVSHSPTLRFSGCRPSNLLPCMPRLHPSRTCRPRCARSQRLSFAP